MIYTFIIIILKMKGIIETVYRTRPLFYISAMLFMFLHLLFYTMNQNSQWNCDLTNTLQTLFFSLGHSSINLAEVHQVFLHVRRKKAKNDVLLYIYGVVLVFALQLIFYFSVFGNEKQTFTLVINDIDVKIEKCGRLVLESIFSYIIPVFFYLIF